MKLKAPADMSGFSFKGVPIEINDKGLAEASSTEMEAEMRAHGFTTPEDKEPAKTKARRSAE